MRIYHRFCRAFAAGGHSALLLAHDDGQVGKEGVEIGFLEPPYHQTMSLRFAERFRRCRTAYRQALESGADFFMFYSPEFIPWALPLGRRTGRPVIFDCMEDFEGYVHSRRGIPDAVRSPFALAVRSVLLSSARRLDALTVADTGTGEYYSRHARRVVTIHNFPSLSYFPGDLSTTPEFDVVFHGVLSRHDLKRFLAIDQELVKRGRHVKWYLVGRMVEREWFEGCLDATGAAARFHTAGPFPHDRIAEEIARARIGLVALPDYAKFRLNIPQKIFEYMAMQMPFVVSDLPPVRPFVGNNETGILADPNDIASYAEAIIRLLDDEDLYARMARTGREHFEERYNWEQESRKLLELYASLANAV
jgi:glycosyltransferase involved in cell wall biosynthesis